MYISKKKVLTKYINKYVTPKYPLIKTINVDTAFVNPKGLLNVDLTIFCYKKDFLNLTFLANIENYNNKVLCSL